MQSHLSRRIFRCIIANEPITHSSCSLSRRYSSTTQWHHTRLARHQPSSQCLASRQQKREIFSFLGSRGEAAAGLGLDPGVERMMDYEKRVRLRARLPKVEDLESAIQSYTRKKLTQGQSVPDTHARLLRLSFEYIFEQRKKEALEKREDWTQTPWSEEMATRLRDTAKILCLEVEPVAEDHVKLAELLLTEGTSKPSAPRARLVNALVTVLCKSGQPLRARDLLVQRALSASDTKGAETELDEPAQDESIEKNLSTSMRSVWRHVLHSFVLQDNEAEALRTIELIEKYGIGWKRTFAGTMLQLYAKRHDIEQTKHWFQKWRQESYSSTSSTLAQWDADTLRLVLECCFATEQHELGNNFVRAILDDTPVKQMWDEVLVWALKTQKSVDEVDRMIGVMLEEIQNTTDVPNYVLKLRRPNIQTINRLVETAIQENDPYMAERLINVGRKYKIQRDAKSLVLQMEYRLRVGDVDGALVAYKHLQSKDLGAREHVGATNDLIVALCRSKRHDYETIMNVVADMADQRAPFTVETVTTLCLVHLRRDEFNDLTDLIRTHVTGYSSADRLVVQQAIVDYCLDPKTPMAQVWDSYEILRNDFDEMDRATRIKFMQVCFEHDRGDLAAQVFHHMRRHSRLDTIPTSDTYVTAFLLCACAKDSKSLELLYNQLKLDFNIDLDTKLRNALMLAFTACDQPQKAYRVWEDIVDSREGPSYNSIHIIFRNCEIMPLGDEVAEDVWRKLRMKNIDVDQSLWASYLAGVAGTGTRLQTAMTRFDEAVRANEIDADQLIIGSLYNAAALTRQHKVVEEWAQQSYPHMWQDLCKLGFEDNEDGDAILKLDRKVAP